LNEGIRRKPSSTQPRVFEVENILEGHRDIESYFSERDGPPEVFSHQAQELFGLPIL